MTLTEARNAMFDIFYTGVWQATGYKVKWPDLPEFKPTDDIPWARVHLLHQNGGQGSLSGDLGAKRWDRAGVLTIQIFTPIGTGLSEGYNMAQNVLTAYEGTAIQSLWFRNARIREAPSDGAFNQINVVIDFEYDEVH